VGRDGTPTYGGAIVDENVDENYLLRIGSIPLDKAAPLLCAGATLYSRMTKCHRRTPAVTSGLW
jgi:D-arabinose 1-dehydrogenase-like Zn-dependent alcohol dehydrogenase